MMSILAAVGRLVGLLALGRWVGALAGVGRGGGGVGRRVGVRAVGRLAGLAALLCAVGVGVVLVVGPVGAQSPGVVFELSLVEDSDNIVPAGSSAVVRAAVKSEGYAEERLALSSAALRVSAALEWESVGRSRLAAAAQSVGGGGYDVWGKFVRFDGRTLLSRGVGKIEVIDLETQEKVGEFTYPTTAEINASRDTTAGPHAGGDYPASVAATENAATVNWGRAFDVWQEDADTAWLFVGSPNDRVSTHPGIGRLYIYKVDYSADPPTIALERSIEPHPNDYLNDFTVVWDPSGNGKAIALFGWGVAVSADGTTLAVTAPDINEIGAVYVYERPGQRTPTHGPGGSTTNTHGTMTAAAVWADWGDLTQNSGTKLSAIGVPDWDGDGDTKATMAAGFVPNTLRHWGLQTCTAACQEVWSYAYTDFGKDAVALSADGSVLVVGAQQKMFNGSFTPGRYEGASWNSMTRSYDWREDWEGHFRNGEAYVFQRASSATYWKSSASMLAPDTATNAHRLLAQPWGTGPGVQNFGARVAVSKDGASVAVSAPGAAYGDGRINTYTKVPPTRDGKVYVFNRAAAEWPQSGLTSSPGATLGMAGTVSKANGNEQFGGYGVSFRADGARLAVTHEHYGRRPVEMEDGRVVVGVGIGAAWIFSGTAGAWRDADTSTAQLLVAPTPVSGSGFGYATYGNEENDAGGTGDERLAIGGGANSLWLYDEDLRVILNPANGGACTIQRGEDNALRTDDDTVVCELAMPDGTIVIPAGIPDGTFTIAGSAIINEQTYNAALDVRIGQVDELAQVEFGFATDDRGTVSPLDDGPYANVIAAGETTGFRLRLLNEGGKASARGAAASVRVVSTSGSLSTTLGGGCEQSGRVCLIPVAALNAANSDQIVVRLAHPGRGRTGTAQVWAGVVSTSGKSFTTERLDVTFSGAATAVAIGAPSAALLGYDPDAGTSDRRHEVRLAVSATDKDGNRAEIPEPTSIGQGRSFYRVTLTGPDGKAVAVERPFTWLVPPPLPGNEPVGAKIEVEWPVAGVVGNSIRLIDQDGNLQARVTIIAGQATPLASGEYTLELRAGTLIATQAFTVTSGARSVALSAEPGGAVEQGGQVTVTATVTDSSGAAVPDGTPITFAERSTGTEAVMVLLSSTMQRTAGGVASVMLQAVGTGGAYVQATADGVTNVALLSAVAPRIPAVELMTSTMSNSYSVWTGSESIMVSALLPALEGISEISMWKDGRWLRYGVVDGMLASGSVDFPIGPGEVVWLCGVGGSGP